MTSRAPDETQQRKVQWLDLGILCGAAASIAYTLAVFLQLPRLASFLTFSAFGPLLCVACVGLYVFLREHRETVSLQIGTLFLVFAGLMVTAMATMQGSIIFDLRWNLFSRVHPSLGGPEPTVLAFLF